MRALDVDPSEVSNHAARFRREMRLCAELSHPNIVRLIDSGESADGELYGVFEFVPGATLRDVLRAEGKLEIGEAVHMMAQVLDALACAHASGVVHRDLKPENVMITKTGARRNAMVLDFGLGGFASEDAMHSAPRITAAQEILGTPCYAAPEQLRGEPPSPLSDLYSWGLLFLECLTGELPVAGASPQAVVQKQLGPEPITIPEWLQSPPLGPILKLVTAKQASKRAITPGAILRALSQGGEANLARVPEPALQTAESEYERRQLTIVCFRFTVLEGNRPIDVEEVARTLRAHHAALAERAARAGGTVGTIAGDRALVVFGYPRAREDDTRRAARLAVDFVTEPPPASGDFSIVVGAGLHSGLAVVREPHGGASQRITDLMGLTPEIAIQLAEEAADGEVLATGELERALRNDFDMEPAGQCSVRALSQPIAVSRLRAKLRSAGDTESRVWSRDTPLVGRAGPLQHLLDAWASAGAGRGGVTILVGEAGIGKSRLLYELRSRAGVESWVEWRCAPENQTTPLRPVTDALATLDPSIESLLSRLALDLGENLPLFGALLSLPPDERYPPPRVLPDRLKELTLRALVHLHLELAAERPFLLAIENLQWADATTLELVGLLAEELRAARQVSSEAGPRLYVLATTRPEVIPAWGEDVVLLPLQRLVAADVETMARASVPAGANLAPEVIAQVSRRAEGVPLFVEELMRAVVESAGGEGGGGEASIPQSLRDLLTARLDRVSPAARDTAHLAAVLGREFGDEMLRAVATKDAAFVRDDVEELLRAGLVLRRRSGRTEEYVFRHALLRDAAYETMTRPRRRELHRRVAGVLRERFPVIGDRRPEILARHFEEAGDLGDAVTHWYHAGLLALSRAAYVEALAELERGASLIERLAPSTERSRLEVELLTALGTAHVSTRGFGAEEVRPIFARARALCEGLGDTASLQVLGGIYGAGVTTADRESTEEILPHFRRLAEREADPAAAFAGNQVLGVQSFWIGDTPAAKTYLSRAMDLYRREEVQGLAWEYGYGLYCYGYGLLTLFQIGLPDRAETTRREMTAIAEASGNPYCVAIALGFGLTLTHDRGEIDETAALSERLLSLANEQHLYFWASFAHCGLGAAFQRRGQPDEGAARIRQGLELLKMLGVRSSYAYYLTFLASALCDGGRIEEGLAVVEESMALAETSIARAQVPELWRLRGELLARRGDRQGAESALRRALAIAHERQALASELRAATTLCGLLETDGERTLLRAVYQRFHEGLDTRDLREARARLSE